MPFETSAAPDLNSDRMRSLCDLHSEVTDQLLSQFLQSIGVNVRALIQHSLTSLPTMTSSNTDMFQGLERTA